MDVALAVSMPARLCLNLRQAGLLPLLSFHARKMSGVDIMLLISVVYSMPILASKISSPLYSADLGVIGLTHSS